MNGDATPVGADGAADRAPRAVVPLTTARLRLAPFTLTDAPFIVRLLNDPGFLRFVGDRNVRDEEQARAYLAAGPIDSFARRGFGGYHVVRAADGASLGMCGLFQRDVLDAPDLGYALLAEHQGCGYAREACAAVIADARGRLGVARLFAVITPDNARSIRLAEGLGFRFERKVRISRDDVELCCYVLDFGRGDVGREKRRSRAT